jgi:hypothetical protein
MTGSHEVRGSIPLGSTNNQKISSIGKKAFCRQVAFADRALTQPQQVTFLLPTAAEMRSRPKSYMNI